MAGQEQERRRTERSGTGRPGIYVGTLIRADLDRVWQLTQEPGIHQRWDLRFSRIEYLPRASEAEPQRFLYETRIGLGLAIAGTGESVAQREGQQGELTSSLRFASDDPKSLIRSGSGYWKYVPVEGGVHFFTWYDYETRFGAAGRLADAVFRPLIGWATAWSFDRLRLWAERDLLPETAMQMATMHAVARLTIALIWLWHGLVPKLLFRDVGERVMLAQAGAPAAWLPWIGAGEVLVGLLVLATWTTRAVLLANAVVMVVATVLVAITSPATLTAAFNPVTLNLAVAALAVVGWMAARRLPSAGRCVRVDPRLKPGADAWRRS